MIQRKFVVDIHAAHQLNTSREGIGHYDILPCGSCLVAVLCSDRVGEGIAYIGSRDAGSLVDNRSSFALVNLNAAVRHGSSLAVIIENSSVYDKLAL